MTRTAAAPSARGQALLTYHGDTIPDEVELMYLRGLEHLKATQGENGAWAQPYGSEPGVVGLCVLSMLAHGEDPNFGPYSCGNTRGLNGDVGCEGVILQRGGGL